MSGSSAALQAINDRRKREEAYRQACDREWEPGHTITAAIGKLERYGRVPGWDWNTIDLSGWEKCWAEFGNLLKMRSDLATAMDAELPGLIASKSGDRRSRESFAVLAELIASCRMGRKGLSSLKELVKACDDNPDLYKDVSSFLGDVSNAVLGYLKEKGIQALCDEFPEQASADGYRSARVSAPRPITPSEEAGPPPKSHAVQVDDNDLAILDAIGRAEPRLLRLVEVEAAVDLSKRTVGKLVKRLLEMKLIHRPRGNRSGIGLTEAGKLLLMRIAAQSIP